MAGCLSWTNLGRARSTPVSPLRVGSRRYVIALLPQADWARNARAAGHGELSGGRRRRPVELHEVRDSAIRREVMRTFPGEVPTGVRFFVGVGLVTGPDPDQFAAAADRVAVFEIVEPSLDPSTTACDSRLATRDWRRLRQQW